MVRKRPKSLQRAQPNVPVCNKPQQPANVRKKRRSLLQPRTTHHAPLLFSHTCGGVCRFLLGTFARAVLQSSAAAARQKRFARGKSVAGKSSYFPPHLSQPPTQRRAVPTRVFTPVTPSSRIITLLLLLLLLLLPASPCARTGIGRSRMVEILAKIDMVS